MKKEGDMIGKKYNGIEERIQEQKNVRNDETE
jgi:hypothetical protein